MAPKKQTTIAASQSKTDTSRSDSQSMDASQDLESTRIQELMNKHNQRAKERRKERKDEIVSAHKARMEKLHRDIKQCLQKHDDDVRAVRRPKDERLIHLAHKKQALQSQIDKCQSDFEQGFLSTARQLQVALDGRVEELSV